MFVDNFLTELNRSPREPFNLVLSKIYGFKCNCTLVQALSAFKCSLKFLFSTRNTSQMVYI